MEIIEIKSCEVCANSELISVLNLGNHPLCDDLVPVGSDRECVEYPIEILFCETCSTAHQRFQVPKHDLFTDSYHYRSRFTVDVLNGMKSLVDSYETYLTTLDDKVVLDIGCNDGSLLDFFKEKGSLTIGVEPTAACSDSKDTKHKIYNTYFSQEVAEAIIRDHGYPDLITFTNVFAHIEDLPAVINSLKLLCKPTTMLAIENHYLGAVLEKNQFDTFYHEHPRSYSFTSFFHISKALGMKINHLEFPSRYGGNIRVFLGGASHASLLDTQLLMQKERCFLHQFKLMSQNIEKWKESKQEFIKQVVKQTRLIGKAFPGRAAILIKMLGIDESILSAVYEKPGSMKIGHYIPGTRIPIFSDDDLFNKEEKPSAILNLAWHISDEIRTYLAAMGLSNTTIIDILNKNDWEH